MTHWLGSLTYVVWITTGVILALRPHVATAQDGAVNGEWSTYAGDLGGTKYSPLDQIDGSNFSELEIAWRWVSADGSLDLDALRTIHPELSIRNLNVTPLMVGGVVYVVTPMRVAAALDAGTGVTQWLHDPDVIRSTRRAINGSGYSLRGLAYWEDEDDTAQYGSATKTFRVKAGHLPADYPAPREGTIRGRDIPEFQTSFNVTVSQTAE